MRQAVEQIMIAAGNTNLYVHKTPGPFPAPHTYFSRARQGGTGNTGAGRDRLSAPLCPRSPGPVRTSRKDPSKT
jgi:hypothetical protein